MTSPDIDLDDQMKDLVWQFRDQLHRNVDLDARERTERVVSSLLMAAESLTEPMPDEWREAIRDVDGPANDDRLEGELRAGLALRFHASTEVMARRVRELAGHAVPFPPSSSGYVTLLTRCFVLGHFQEMSIVAGAIVEAELDAAFRGAKVPLPATPAGKSIQFSKIDAAYQLGWLSRDGRRAAKTLWIRRNKVVHDDPDIGRQPFDTITLVGRVLHELCVAGLEDRASVAEHLDKLKLPPSLYASFMRFYERGWRHQQRLKRDRRRGT